MGKRVIVEKYNESWKKAFEDIKSELEEALGNLALRIEHVGSTSVEGLSAKPIIDIDVVIEDESKLSQVIEAFKRIGYQHEGDLGIPGREAFKYDGKEHLMKHHLYVCAENSRELKRHVSFRDYLRSHPEAVQEYSQVKEEGARLYPDDMDKYIEHKSPLIERIYKKIELLEEFVTRSQDILKDNLVGVYLHGSSVMGCFNPAKSDIDLIVVTEGKMSDTEKRKYMDMVMELNNLGPAKGIEMSVVLKKDCNPFVYPTPFDLHFSEAHVKWYSDNPENYISKMNGTDADLAAHFTVIRKRGKCLYGLPIEQAFGEVPKEDYFDSIWKDIADAKDDIQEDTMYITLNLARVLAYKREELVLSKKEGGEWALDKLPEEFHPLINEALNEYAEGTDGKYDMECAVRYAEYMLREIEDE